MALTLLDRMTLTGSQTLRQPVGHFSLHFLFYSSSSMREWCKKKSEAGRVVRAVQSRVFCSLVLLWKWENNGLKLLPNRRVHRQLWAPRSRCVYVAFMSLHSLHPQTFCGKKKNWRYADVCREPTLTQRTLANNNLGSSAAGWAIWGRVSGFAITPL